jgi:hypothetical protein
VREQLLYLLQRIASEAPDLIAYPVAVAVASSTAAPSPQMQGMNEHLRDIYMY